MRLPTITALGSAVHEISGGCGCISLKLAAHAAMPFLLPSLRVAFTVKEPASKPAVPP